jgi:hypothetical protein
MRGQEDRAQAVRDDDGRATERIEAVEDLLFGDGVQIAGGLVEQQNGRSASRRSDQRDSLPLTAGQRGG